MLILFLAVLAFHFIGDFYLQSPSNATNKSKDNSALTLHVATYTGVLLVGSVVLFYGKDPAYVLGWVWFNGAMHWGTDYVTSRINSKLWKEERVHDFFVGVGFDQYIHSLTLGFSMIWLLS
jgi:uncharacterized protein DUF3307